jgi:hypothetical protein
MFKMQQKEYIDIMQQRLDWCIETERYEMAARLRDLIKYESTEDSEYKQEYYYQLLERYAPDFLEVIRAKKDKTLNV